MSVAGQGGRSDQLPWLEIRIHQHPEDPCRIHHRGRTEGMLAEPQNNPSNESIVEDQSFLMNTRRSPAAEHVPEYCGQSAHDYELNESERKDFNRNSRHGILHRSSLRIREKILVMGALTLMSGVDQGNRRAGSRVSARDGTVRMAHYHFRFNTTSNYPVAATASNHRYPVGCF